MTSLEGQAVLVVGGSSGIGFSVARLSLLSKASLVTIASSNKSNVDSAVTRLLADDDVKRLVPNASTKVKGEVVDAKVGKEIKALMERVGEVDHVVWTSGDTFGKMAFPPKGELDELKGQSSFAIFESLTYPNALLAKDLYDIRFWGAIEAANSAKIKAGGSLTITSG